MSEALSLPFPETPPCAPQALRLDTPLMQALRLMDRLNSFARSHSQGIGWPPKRWIYCLKRTALERVLAAGLVTARNVCVRSPCRSGCTKGIWRGRKCRYCDNEGMTTLRFVETVIGGEIRWHHPRHDAPIDIPGCRYDDADATTEWRPLHPGRELPLTEALDALMIVEALFWPRSTWHSWSYDGDFGEEDLSQYAVYLGEVDQSKCRLCGVALVLGDHRARTRWHVTIGRLEWTDCICKPCDGPGEMGGHRKVKALGVPPELVAHPSIQRWIATHPERPGGANV